MMTKWKCPECELAVEIEAYELATIGTPICTDCDGIEMEPDAPEPEILSRDQLITRLAANLLKADRIPLMQIWFAFYDGEIEPTGDDSFEIFPAVD